MAPKFLFLHGFGESNMLAGNSTSTLLEVLKPEGIALESMDGFTKLEDGTDFDPIPDEEYKSLCRSGDIEAYCWYPIVPKEKKFNHADGGHRATGTDFDYQPKSAEAIKSAVDGLIKHIESIGGVDAIVGFSQGGELAYLLLESLSRLGSTAQNKLKFIATFGSEDTFLNTGKKCPKLPSKLHFFLCYGDKDEDAVRDVPTTSKKLKDAGGNTTVKKIAGHGHNMPKDKAVYKEMLKAFRDAEKGKAVVAAAPEPEYKPEKPEFWCVMTDPEGRCSTGKSDSKPVKPGTKYNDQWTIVATDFTEEDAKLYIRMNWKDMTPKSVADGHRSWDHPKYKDYTEAEYDALWYRMTKAEFVKSAPAARIAEAEAAEQEKIKAAEKAAEREAKAKEAEERGEAADES